MSKGLEIAWLKKMFAMWRIGLAGSLREAERAARARHVGRQEGMQSDGQAELLAGPPDRVVDRVVELLAVDGGVGAEEDAHQPQVPGAADDTHGARHVLVRHDADAEEALRCRGAVLGEPLVVGVCLYLGEVGVLERGKAEEERRVEDRLFDAVRIHVHETRERPEGAGPDFRVLHLATARPLAVGGRHAADAGECESVRGPLPTVVAEPLAAVGTRHDLPDPVAELRRRALGHAGGRLEDVAVGVDDGGVLHAAAASRGVRRDARGGAARCPTVREVIAARSSPGQAECG